LPLLIFKAPHGGCCCFGEILVTPGIGPLDSTFTRKIGELTRPAEYFPCGFWWEIPDHANQRFFLCAEHHLFILTLSSAIRRCRISGERRKSRKPRRRIDEQKAGQLQTGIGKRTRFGLALEESAEEILAHVKGETKLPVRRVVLPDEVDVKLIRSRARMSQAEFARAFCINPRTLQEWEQGRRKPDATTRAILR
jgi:putative transcriptional regulator